MPNFDFIPEAPTPVGLHKQLFVDDYIMAEKVNVGLEVGQGEKTRCCDGTDTFD